MKLVDTEVFQISIIKLLYKKSWVHLSKTSIYRQINKLVFNLLNMILSCIWQDRTKIKINQEIMGVQIISLCSSDNK